MILGFKDFENLDILGEIDIKSIDSYDIDKLKKYGIIYMANVKRYYIDIDSDPYYELPYTDIHMSIKKYLRDKNLNELLL